MNSWVWLKQVRLKKFLQTKKFRKQEVQQLNGGIQRNVIEKDDED